MNVESWIKTLFQYRLASYFRSNFQFFDLPVARIQSYLEIDWKNLSCDGTFILKNSKSINDISEYCKSAIICYSNTYISCDVTGLVNASLFTAFSTNDCNIHIKISQNAIVFLISIFILILFWKTKLMKIISLQLVDNYI